MLVEKREWEFWLCPDMPVLALFPTLLGHQNTGSLPEKSRGGHFSTSKST
jgi:hypothetical protein